MDIKSIINKYSCTFLDTSLENEFQSSEWERNRKKFLIKILVGISIAVLGFFIALNVHNQNLQKITYSNYNKWGAYWIMLIHTINAAIYTLLIFANEIQKKKYGNNIFAITVASIILAVNVKSFTGTDLEYIPGNMIAYFWPAYPLTLSVLIIIIFETIKFHHLLTIYLISFIPALLLFIIKGNAPKFEALFFIIIPSFYLLFYVYQNQIKSRYAFYFENLTSKGLKKYFGETLTEKLINDEGQLDGKTEWVTISFTDLANYSTIIEKMSPKIAVEFLNEYYSTIHNVIKKHNGMILNYIGDSVMVIYGAPKKQKNHEVSAVEASLEIREKIKLLNEKWEENQLSRYWKNLGIKQIICRTGVHCGNLIVGNIGSDDLMQYSAIGDVVNIASRLESVNKEFGTNIAISEEVYTTLTQELIEKTKLEGEINLKGRSKTTNVYSL